MSHVRGNLLRSSSHLVLLLDDFFSLLSRLGHLFLDAYPWTRLFMVKTFKPRVVTFIAPFTSIVSKERHILHADRFPLSAITLATLAGATIKLLLELRITLIWS